MLKNRDFVEIFSDLVYISQKKKNLMYKSLNLMSLLSRRNNLGFVFPTGNENVHCL